MSEVQFEELTELAYDSPQSKSQETVKKVKRKALYARKDWECLIDGTGDVYSKISTKVRERN